MDSVLSILNQPIVLTLVSLMVGGFLLNLITERRAKENRLQEKKIEFISELARNINAFLPSLYQPLRTGNLGVTNQIADDVRDLMATRMTVQIGSQAFLRSEDFYLKYNLILDELLVFIQVFSKAADSQNAEGLVSRVADRRARLLNRWPLSETLSDPGRKITDELIVWLDMIMHRATSLLSSSLKESIG